MGKWKNIFNDLGNFWNYPHPQCLGAIDGKHISIKTPPNTGSGLL